MTDDRVGTTFGPYRIVDLIGRGGMGEVYRAYDTIKDREVALKLLPRELAGDVSYRGRFEREARVAARLQEPHVIPIHDFGRIDDVLFMDMRLVRGKDLRAVLRRPERMSVPFAVDLARQMTDALGAAHADGLVHRDVKPENILLLPSGFAYLADFGIAARTDEARLTSAGTAIGSFAYMAPERFQDAPVSPASDIYSLGCVLYECLAGRPPFNRGTVSSLIQAHLSQTPQPLTSIRHDVPPALEAVVARAMAKDPQQRFASAHDFGEALAAAVGGYAGPELDPSAAPTVLAAGSLAAATQPRPRPGRSRTDGTATFDRRQGAVLIAAMAAALLVAAFIAWQSFGRSSSNAQGGVSSGAGSALGLSSTEASTTSSTSSTATTTSGGSPSSTAGRSSSSSSVSTDPNGHTTTVTVTGSNSGSSSPSSTSSSDTSTTSTSSSSSPTWSSTLPPGNGYDWQGWTAYAAVQCSGDDRAITVADTADSLVTICESHSGTRYYLGLRPSQPQPNSLRLAYPVRSEGGWLARTSNGSYNYLVTPSALTITNTKTGTSQSEPVNTYQEVG